LEYTLEHAHEATFSQPKDYELWWEAREEELLAFRRAKAAYLDKASENPAAKHIRSLN